MAQIIPNGGDRDSEDDLIGLPNELRVDQSNRELRLHDGSKPGGFRLPNLDSLLKLFQKQNDDLDGFSKLKPNLRGFLIRLSAGTYAMRKLVGEGGVEVDNPDGYDGNPTIRLGGEITQDMTFTGDVLVKKVLQAEGGINGNTDGTHSGLVKGADIDARGQTLTLDDDQIPQSAVSGLAEALSGTALPIGVIMLWAGTIANVPAGWRLCDGSGGTPNLAGRFVRGADASTQATTGGAASHGHLSEVQPNGAHTHAGDVGPFTLEEIHIPAHQHRSGVCDNASDRVFNASAGAVVASSGNIQSEPGAGVYEAIGGKVGGGQPHDHSFSMDSAGEHTHGIAIQPADHIPPYFALAYIMKVS
jgi:hypothetical protein